MTYNVLMGTLNPTHSLTHSLTQLSVSLDVEKAKPNMCSAGWPVKL